MSANNHNTIATLIHLSTFCRFILPFGNFIGPIILWQANKDKSEFINSNGKQAINFQISILIYSLIIGVATVPFFIFKLLKGIDFLDFNIFNGVHFNINHPTPLFYFGGTLGALAVIGFILELIFIIKASLKAKEGKNYSYPLTIEFIK